MRGLVAVRSSGQTTRRAMKRRRPHEAEPADVPASSLPFRWAAAEQPAIASTPASKALLRAWRNQLAQHNAAEPVWLSRRLLRPGTLVASTVELFEPLAKLSRISMGIELWAQQRSTTLPMHLHFDLDEQHYRLTRAVLCPRYISILYMSACGGPTLVLEHRPGDAWQASVRLTRPRIELGLPLPRSGVLTSILMSHPLPC